MVTKHKVRFDAGGYWRCCLANLLNANKISKKMIVRLSKFEQSQHQQVTKKTSS